MSPDAPVRGLLICMAVGLGVGIGSFITGTTGLLPVIYAMFTWVVANVSFSLISLLFIFSPKWGNWWYTWTKGI